MASENDEKSFKMRRVMILILGVVFIAVILMSMCAWGVLSLTQKKEPQSVRLHNGPVLFIPKASLPTPMQASHFLIHLPFLSRAVPVAVPGRPGPVTEPDLSETISEQIWEVTNINKLGYELDGQHYDLATFTRTDGQDTATAYCINWGWDVPDIGTEYLLNAEGIFVPLHESDTHPVQRFLQIR